MPDPPPVITISDPNRPGPPVDLMVAGHERDPWRPGRRTWSLVAVLAVLAAIDNPPAETVPLGLRNDGTLPITVQSLQVLAPGYREVRLNKTIVAYGIETISVPDTATCAPTLLTKAPEAMRVHLRTGRGQLLTRDLDLTLAGGRDLGAHAASRCRYLTPQDAVVPTDADVTSVGRDVTLGFRLLNVGRLPLRLLGLTPQYGLSLRSRPGLPLTLAPLGTVETPGGVPLTLRLHLDDCALADSALQLQALTLTFEVQGPTTHEGVALSFDVDGEQFQRWLKVLGCSRSQTP